MAGAVVIAVKVMVGVEPVVEPVILLACPRSAVVAVVESNKIVLPINCPAAVSEFGDDIEETTAVVGVPPEQVPLAMACMELATFDAAVALPLI